MVSALNAVVLLEQHDSGTKTNSSVPSVNDDLIKSLNSALIVAVNQIDQFCPCLSVLAMLCLSKMEYIVQRVENKILLLETLMVSFFKKIHRHVLRIL
ncbi:hypothetical protein A2239_00270 [Candidatus Uhrbacteria bacterium RIFOXYA2_FULL_40_9]|nr:MAG: hypothetical protein A2239_00270 [Candidatus Uhrbacteria bacterium RIFOXYA2_FULL_40_9]OGL97563.1 MAG: hypothetical protein A2332_03445 [Candidatus Uhrbacteria bacterium RIFOXYB2_FULL_41_18]